MNELKKSKEEYDTIPIPKELNKIVLSAIKESEQKIHSSVQDGSILFEQTDKKSILLKKRKMIYRVGIGTAASFLIAAVIGVNTSQTFAMVAQELPVVGALAKIVTIRSYESNDKDTSISIEIPSIEYISNNTTGLAKEVNKEIFNICNSYAEESLKRAEEYKTAFLETGGTQEEWEKHNIKIKVGYEIKSQSEEYLSLLVRCTENWSSAYTESRYYNLNLKNNQYVTLKDVLGDNYILKANASIQKQIEERKKSGDLFFDKENGGFETITDDSKFYMNEVGNPVIVFNKYEIAPGAMGEVSFEIER